MAEGNDNANQQGNPAEAGQAAVTGAESVAAAADATEAQAGAQGTEAGASGEQAAEAGARPASAAAPAEKKEDWRDKRIAVLTARLRETEAREAALAAEPRPVVDAEGRPVASEADVERRAAELASQRAQVAEFNRRCNDARDEGLKAHSDFDEKVKNITGNLVDAKDPKSVEKYNGFLVAALETGAAAELIYRLGSDLNEAQRILDLPPTKMAIELTKMAMPKAEGVSVVPKPINPVGARGASHEKIEATDPERADRLDIKTWMERREADVKKKQESGVRIW